MQDATLADMPNKLRRTRTLTVKVKRNTVGSTRQKAKTDTELCEPSVNIHVKCPGNAGRSRLHGARPDGLFMDPGNAGRSRLHGARPGGSVNYKYITIHPRVCMQKGATHKRRNMHQDFNLKFISTNATTYKRDRMQSEKDMNSTRKHLEAFAKRSNCYLVPNCMRISMYASTALLTMTQDWVYMYCFVVRPRRRVYQATSEAKG